MDFLAADIGGTKTILATFSFEDGSIRPRREKEFSSHEYSDLSKLLEEFLSKDARDHPSLACFGLAGPVLQGKAELTNINWHIDARELSKTFGFRVELLNDLVASANYVPYLKHSEIQTVHKGVIPKDGENGAIAVIAPGTGLGESFLTREKGRWSPHASEGGHCDFAPTSETEQGLLEYMRKKFGHVSCERVCSGPGIYNIFSYFHETAGMDSSKCSAIAKIPETDDPTPVIVAEAMKKGSKCQMCVKSLDTFVSVLATEAGNLGLKVLATNGVYISGGVVLQVLPALMKERRFAREFERKGRMSELVAQMPVNVIMTHRSVLLGAAHYALEKIKEPDTFEMEKPKQVLRRKN